MSTSAFPTPIRKPQPKPKTDFGPPELSLLTLLALGFGEPLEFVGMPRNPSPARPPSDPYPPQSPRLPRPPRPAGSCELDPFFRID